MKIILTFLTCCFFACNTTVSTVKKGNAAEMIKQEATVEAHIITRGKFQYVISVPSGPHAGKYLPKEEPAEAYCQDGLRIIIDAQMLEEKGALYKPGPTDIPEKSLELPMIQITSIAKQQD